RHHHLAGLVDPPHVALDEVGDVDGAVGGDDEIVETGRALGHEAAGPGGAVDPPHLAGVGLHGDEAALAVDLEGHQVAEAVDQGPDGAGVDVDDVDAAGEHLGDVGQPVGAESEALGGGEVAEDGDGRFHPGRVDLPQAAGVGR